MAMKWLDDMTFQIDLELIEPPPQYNLDGSEPLEFIRGIEEGTIPLIFTSSLTIKMEFTNTIPVEGDKKIEVGKFKEINREVRNTSRAERKAYVEQYRKFCSMGQAHARKIFFVLPECMDIQEGVITFKIEFFKDKKGVPNA